MGKRAIKASPKPMSTKHWLLETLIAGGRRAVIASMMDGDADRAALSARYAKAILLVTQCPEEPTS